MTTAPPALPGRTWNKRLKESRELACLLLGMADMRVACYLPFGVVHYIIVDKIGGELPSILWIIFQIVGLAVSFAGVAVVASLLSDIYRGLFPADAQAERRAS